MQIYGPTPGIDRNLLNQQAYDDDTGTLLLLLTRGPQPIALLTAVLGVSRDDIDEWVASLRSVGHDVSIDAHGIVALR